MSDKIKITLDNAAQNLMVLRALECAPQALSGIDGHEQEHHGGFLVLGLPHGLASFRHGLYQAKRQTLDFRAACDEIYQKLQVAQEHPLERLAHEA